MRTFIFGALSLCILLPIAVAEESWQKADSGISETDIRAIAAPPTDKDVLFAGTTKGIYKTTDGAKNWKLLYPSNVAINYIAISPKGPLYIYAATGEGLIYSTDGGTVWQTIFRGVGELERYIQHIAIRKGRVYIGTRNGLFASTDTGETWLKDSGIPQAASVYYIHPSDSIEGLIFVATSRGLFKSKDSGAIWRRVFVTGTDAEFQVEEASDSEVEAELGLRDIRCVFSHPKNFSTIYLGTRIGMYRSLDEGETFVGLTNVGLKNRDIRAAAISPRSPYDIYVATPRGIFRYDSQKDIWDEPYSGFVFASAQALAFSPTETSILYAASKGGIFRHTLRDDSYYNVERALTLSSLFAKEPTIQEVQREAIRYAEVYPGKIKEWRLRAKTRAILPTFNLDYDKTIYTSGGTSFVGPRDWGFGLSWNLGDLVYSDDQTNIDVRSRLMVQLRDDILNEATKLYYERRRLQTELILNPPQDTKDKVMKELRLEELTAGIDALTGGYFSRRLQKK